MLPSFAPPGRSSPTSSTALPPCCAMAAEAVVASATYRGARARGRVRYARKLGFRRQVGGGGPGALSGFRELLLERSPPRPTDAEEKGGEGVAGAYAARRIAWHVLDHAWEIEDSSEPPGAGG